jgi:hypothetical protein
MQLITVRNQVKAAHFTYNTWQPYIRGDSETVYNRLTALDLANCAPREVDTIIGNTAWTTVYCSECETPVDAAILFGDDDNHFLVCAECLRQAVEEMPG